ncbi:MAG: glycosyltransferase family 4 protein [Bacteroidales bacterium]
MSDNKLREKIAFVVIRYGKEVNGGAEVHCRLLAERLTPYYDVEVLTTNMRDLYNIEDSFEPGVEILENVMVRRFKVDPIQDSDSKLWRRIKRGTKLRRFFHRIGILRYFATCKWLTNWGNNYEHVFLKSNNSYSSELLTFIDENREDYKAFVFLTYLYPLAKYGIKLVPEKSIFIPTAHDESALFMATNYDIFCSPTQYIAFNTAAEQRLCESIFGDRIASSGIVGTGVEVVEPSDLKEVRMKYSLPEEYILYVGRVDSGKINSLIPYFLKYKSIYPNKPIKLVLTGGVTKSTPKVDHPDVIYTGFVSDEDKTAIIDGATVVVNPSKYESLSLILLEALSRRKAMLVNADCEVMNEHVRVSGGAVFSYKGESDFIIKLHTLLSDKVLRWRLGELGEIYVRKNYSWDVVIDKFRSLIDK